MIILVVLLGSLLIALARGGSLSALARVRLRFIWLFFIPLILQLFIFLPFSSGLDRDGSLSKNIYLISMAIAACVLLLNWRVPGLVLVALGLVCNLLVISLNGGFMPVSAAARDVAGMPLLAGRSNNVVPLTNETWLPWLADVIPIPAWVPFANVLSIGDLLIAVGAVLFTQRALLAPPDPAAAPAA